MEEETKTEVFNLLDDRSKVYELAPDRAVIAAYEEFEEGEYDISRYPDPPDHPDFREYRRGFACGDWVARKRAPECVAASE